MVHLTIMQSEALDGSQVGSVRNEMKAVQTLGKSSFSLRHLRPQDMFPQQLLLLYRSVAHCT
jgi:hypothetical protein